MITGEAFVERLVAAKASRSPEAWQEMIREDVVMHTPRFFKPITDRNHVIAVLEGILTILPDFHWHRIWHGDGECVMEFTGHVNGGKTVAHGIDLFEYDEDGRISKLTVFLRPTSALLEIAEGEDAMVREMLEAAAASRDSETAR